jgi:hypothetical protein
MSITYRTWAYTGAILGGGVSIAANIAHSYVPPTDWTPTSDNQHYTPQLGAVIGAVVWPLALFVAVEILARTPWPAGWRWIILRCAGLVPVALVAAFVSYRHLSGLLAYYHEDPLTAAIGPLAVDGLMVMATAALLTTGHHTDHEPTPDDHTTDPATTADSTPAAPTTSAAAPALVALPTHLLPAARFALTSHEQATGRPITASELAARMSITPDTAAALLATLTGNNTANTPAPVNGSAITTGVSR